MDQFKFKKARELFAKRQMIKEMIITLDATSKKALFVSEINSVAPEFKEMLKEKLSKIITEFEEL